MKDFSITTTICLNSSQAKEVLKEGGADLLAIDWERESSMQLLHTLKAYLRRSPAILALADEQDSTPADSVVLWKPITYESGARAMEVAYSRMVKDFRRHVRYDVMTAVVARHESGRNVPMTITNVSDGGVGLSTTEALEPGDVLSFPLPLPGTTNEISAEVRVLWTAKYGAAGGQFVQIPPADLQLLVEWLRSRCRIKKPRIAVDLPV